MVLFIVFRKFIVLNLVICRLLLMVWVEVKLFSVLLMGVKILVLLEDCMKVCCVVLGYV